MAVCGRQPTTMQKPKGKQGTKGQRQIHDENQATIKFYVIMTALSVLIHLVCQLVLFSPTAWDWFMFIVLGVGLQVAALVTMRFMAKASFSGNQLIDAGLDLNMEEGFGEYCKDAVILGFITQVLSLITRYFWLLLLVVPGMALFKLWVNILGPWFFAPAPEDDGDDGGDDKRRKKKEKIKYKRI